MNRNESLLALPVAAALLLALNLATAQDEPKRPERPPGDRPAGERRPGEFRGDRGPEGGPRELANLTDEQRTAFREAMEATREDSMKLGEKMRDARRALQEAIYAEKVDPADIKMKADVVGKIEGEMSVLRAQTFAKVRPKLSPEQIERMKNMPPEMAMRGGFGGPRGPGGPGGPGFNPDQPRRPRGDNPDGATPGQRPQRPPSESDPK